MRVSSARLREVDRVLVPSEQPGRLGDQRRAVEQAGGGHHTVVGLRLERLLGRRGGIEPVTELEARVPEPGRRPQTLDPSDVGGHGRERVGEGGDVPVRLVDRPGDPDRGVAPDRGAVRGRELRRVVDVLQHVGDDERHHAVGVPLLEVQIQQPVAEEALGVEQVDRGRRERRQVTGPAQPLVALGAVGRHVDEVPPGTPDHIAVQPVEQVVGALEGADPLEVGGDHHGRQIVGGQVPGPTVDLQVTEPVEGEGRLEDVLAPAQGEPVGGLGRAQRARAQLVVLEHLRVPEGDHRPGRTLDGEPHPADQVLTEVDQRLPARRGPDPLRRPLVDPAHRRRDVGRQGRGITLAGVYADPAVAGEAGPQPGVGAQPRVHVLTVVEIVGGDRRRTRRPVGIGDDQLPCPSA